MVCKIIEHLADDSLPFSNPNPFNRGLISRAAAALACTSRAHANIICPLRKAELLANRMRAVRFAFCM
jgi:hypothetical protein